MPRAGSEVSSWPAGGGLPDPPEVQLPPAGRGGQTLRRLHDRPQPEAAAAEAEEADARGDQPLHQVVWSGQVGPLHPSQGARF